MLIIKYQVDIYKMDIHVKDRRNFSLLELLSVANIFFNISQKLKYITNIFKLNKTIT